MGTHFGNRFHPHVGSGRLPAMTPYVMRAEFFPARGSTRSRSLRKTRGELVEIRGHLAQKILLGVEPCLLAEVAQRAEIAPDARTEIGRSCSAAFAGRELLRRAAHSAASRLPGVVRSAAGDCLASSAPGRLPMKSSAAKAIPCSAAAARSASWCDWGIRPPVPPRSLERFQLDTRVRCTPTSRATLLGPPKSLTMVEAGSMAANVAIITTNASRAFLKRQRTAELVVAIVAA